MSEYKIYKDGFHDQFLKTRSKVQIIGGGYANGKTTAICVKALRLAKDYPGSNGLIGRSTYPKLNDTVRKVFFEWLPKDWIKSWSESKNTLVLKNGSEINFRYVKQQKREKSATTTSNLLSATYDWIAIDQMDDPEFEYKDFIDLMGRLRGSAEYVGTDPTMPTDGPRWMMITLNPTRNWIYRQVIKPVLDYKASGKPTSQLMSMMQGYRTENIDDLISILTASTYENAHNIAEDYVHSLEALYSGVMKNRFLFGGWEAFEGLVYPMFDQFTHMVSENDIIEWIERTRPQKILEMYDHGISNVSCYMLGFVDDQNNIVVVDGFYQKSQPIEVSIAKIKSIRMEWRVPPNAITSIYSDPAIFRKSAGEFKTVGKSVADIFHANGKGLRMVRGNNEITSGIAKVSSYLTVHKDHRNPFTNDKGSPFIFFNEDRLQFFLDEITDYFYQDADDPNANVDKPMDGKDHSLDALKYGLTSTPSIVAFLPIKKFDIRSLYKWQVAPDGWSDRRSSSRSRYASTGFH